MKSQDSILTNKVESPYTLLRSTDLDACKWTSGFWADKFALCKDAMVPNMEELLCGDIGHALNNFKKAAGHLPGPHQGMFWHDGDFYKWMEAAAYIYAHNRDESIANALDSYIEIIGQAQEEDGYLQTQIQLRPEVDRYENRKYHEMYNTGHLLISACAHHRIFGKDNFLSIAIKHADLLHSIFFPETKQFGRFGFNQTQILGLVELYRVTNDKKYLQLAERFINRRGAYPVAHHPTTAGYPIGDMVQERVPLRQAQEAAGHAVLALYYYAGAAAVYAETGEQQLSVALDRLWKNVTTRKMYVTGAVGQAHYGASSNRDKIEEGFIDDYMLPNLTAYNETCANVCNAIFSRNMLTLRAESKFADVIETVLYNSALSGISVDGKSYFYANPLRMIHAARAYGSHENATETPTREPYLECFCCPPNLVRCIAKVSTWMYGLTKNGISVNLYGGNVLETTLTDGSNLLITQETNYPWEGEVMLKIEECKSAVFEILLRIPDWAKGTKIAINNTEMTDAVIAGTFHKLERSWKPGDVIQLTMPMEVHLIEGHPRVEEIRNQVAIRRGPIVYCLESPDLPPGTNIVDVYLDGKASWYPIYKPDFLGGVVTLQGEILIRQQNARELYQTVTTPEWEVSQVQLVPYHVWCNRGEAEMSVFLPIKW